MLKRLLLDRHSALEDGGRLLLRLGIGVPLVLTHGWATWQGLMAGATQFPDPLGLGSRLSMALAASSELFAASLVCLGLLTRLAAVPLVLNFSVACFLFHRLEPFHEAELAFLYLLGSSLVFLLGPGRFSLDSLLGKVLRRKARAGIAAGVLLMLGCGRTPFAELEPHAQVETVLENLGGLEGLQESGGLLLEGRGFRDLQVRIQGMSPFQPNRVDLSERRQFDFASGRIALEKHGKVNPDADEWIRFVYTPEQPTLILDLLERRAFWDPTASTSQERYSRVVPHILLDEVLHSPPSALRPGDPADGAAVIWNSSSGIDLELQFDEFGERLLAVKYELDLPLRRGTEIRWEFDQYGPVSPIGMFPGIYRILINGELFKEIQFHRIEAGTGASEFFEEAPEIEIPDPPDLLRAPSEPETRPLPQAREIGEGLFLVPGVRGGFHPLVVEFRDSLLVVDAPAGYFEFDQLPAADWAREKSVDAVGDRLLKSLEMRFPDKPVRHLILTHHHSDHIGGIEPFLEKGVEVIASEPTLEFLRAALETGRIRGSLSSRRVQGNLQIEDEIQTVNVIELPENPHSQGMLVVHLPGRKTLYVSDLFEPLAEPYFPSPARLPVMRWFVRWLDESGLDVEQFFAIHGSGRIGMDQLEEIRSINRSRGLGRD